MSRDMNVEVKPGGCLWVVAEICAIAILIACTVWAVETIWRHVPW